MPLASRQFLLSSSLHYATMLDSGRITGLDSASCHHRIASTEFLDSYLTQSLFLNHCHGASTNKQMMSRYLVGHDRKM